MILRYLNICIYVYVSILLVIYVFVYILLLQYKCLLSIRDYSRTFS